MDEAVQQLMTRLDLRPHPEGGHYRETYRAAAQMADGRSLSSAIYYLLSRGERSQIHRIDADEMWHFYAGEPLWVVELVRGGPAQVTVLSAERPQYLVPAHTWFGALPAPNSRYSLVGCTVSPAFEFTHFELGHTHALIAEFPLAADLIQRLADR